MNKHLKELTDVLKTELSKLKERLNEVENTAGGEKVSVSKFSKQEVEEVDYTKLGAKGRFFANLDKIKNN